MVLGILRRRADGVSGRNGGCGVVLGRLRMNAHKRLGSIVKVLEGGMVGDA